MQHQLDLCVTTEHDHRPINPIPALVYKFLFELWESIRFAFRSIATNKLRSFLTTLGIIIGIVSVSSMFTTINGVETAFDDSMAMLGTNVLYVDRFDWGGDDEWWEVQNRSLITESLAEQITEKSSYAAAVTVGASTVGDVQYHSNTLSGVFVSGSWPSFTEVSSLTIAQGRSFTDFDDHVGRQVCVLGSDVAEGLFPNENPLGKSIRISGNRFEVIGVFEKQGKFLGMFSFDGQIRMPLSTFKKRFGVANRDVQIGIKIGSDEEMIAAEDELIGIVRSARQLDAFDENDFAINKSDSFSETLLPVKVAIYSVGLILTGLALLVGGIGVMNIMFVSVKERTKEIGIRKSIGATSRAIMFQFIIEAIAICSIGGAIGILFSVFITMAINEVFTAVLSVGTVALAFAICVGIGVVFGFVPARNAAKSNPIEALRYE